MACHGLGWRVTERTGIDILLIGRDITIRQRNQRVCHYGTHKGPTHSLLISDTRRTDKQFCIMTFFFHSDTNTAHAWSIGGVTETWNGQCIDQLWMNI
jgi:hypothetical protein